MDRPSLLRDVRFFQLSSCLVDGFPDAETVPREEELPRLYVNRGLSGKP